ncbi:NlpC/P60 family protein [Streptomyces somaliensis DSM 40738]|uniref:NlpC/P60 family protein n=1 Tax=Streptomyces somaliensis (strain ATCC 33201 / DSM 40738 / JCM 12659 / KCTC 9044 / NCTC 11332 / NRRL B-12077 / IP 733) TaxID=1134445 RepID=A0AA44DCA9_STRE0|nr:C40 family peptidase [Streptomyces somaliensis]MCQ0024073.1 NlpC/P60 family protein [Streptomyces somaliensis DSM 40738]NKY13586.1 NlpC/P60 family protein [Streptomyces somaliensis DSM 40738]
MAAHRKPRQRVFGGRAGRRAATLALAGAATATAFEGPVHAEPRLTAAQAKARVDRLHREAEAATERYNDAKEKADAERNRLDALRDEAARRTERLNAGRNALGATATAQYRTGGLGPAFRLVLSSDPDRYLRGAALAERVADRQVGMVASLNGQLVEIDRLRKEGDAHVRELRTHEAELNRQKAAVRNRLATARGLLARLTAAERAAYGAAVRAEAQGRPGDTRAVTPVDGVRAPNPRAARAVSYAYGAIGKPYLWGATGPSGYDCSGLVQAAWRAAGVALPRTTYSQINAGQRVTRSQLAPGDLVFFYPGVSHVGIYVGGGRMIHAPRPGSTVRVAPVDEMPWAGAVRVG